MNSKYVRKVTNYLESMKDGAVVDISNSPTREDFIQVAKWYIDSFGQLEFDKNYNKIRKCRI